MKRDKSCRALVAPYTHVTGTSGEAWEEAATNAAPVIGPGREGSFLCYDWSTVREVEVGGVPRAALTGILGRAEGA